MRDAGAHAGTEIARAGAGRGWQGYRGARRDKDPGAHAGRGRPGHRAGTGMHAHTPYRGHGACPLHEAMRDHGQGRP